MTAVRIEPDAFGDPRIEYLGKLAGYSAYEALGRLAHLWRYCTQRQLYIAPHAVIEAIIGAPAETLVRAGLGEPTSDGVRVRGTEGRIEWLAKLRANSKAGGEANRIRLEAKREPIGSYLDSQMDSQEGAKAEPEPSPLSLTPALINSPFGKPPKKGRPKKAKPGELSEAERESARVVLAKLGLRNGVRYAGSPAHVQLIADRLRDGYTELDLRKVIGYCAEQWRGNEKMAGYLRPETLFGPTTITRYIDAARAWFDSLPKEHAQ